MSGEEGVVELDVAMGKLSMVDDRKGGGRRGWKNWM